MEAYNPYHPLGKKGSTYWTSLPVHIMVDLAALCLTPSLSCTQLCSSYGSHTEIFSQPSFETSTVSLRLPRIRWLPGAVHMQQMTFDSCGPVAPAQTLAGSGGGSWCAVSYSQGCGLPCTPCTSVSFIASHVTRPGLGAAWGQIESHMAAIPALVQCKIEVLQFFTSGDQQER